MADGRERVDKAALAADRSRREATGDGSYIGGSPFDASASYLQRMVSLGDTDVEHQAERVGTGLLRTAPAGDPLRASGAQTTLRPEWRAAFERQLGADLSALKIRDDEEAHDRAAAMSARAYAKDGEIHLGRSARERGSSALAQTVAHEVVHVAQQTGARQHGAGAALKSAQLHIPLRDADPVGTFDIPAKWLRKPKKRELVVFTKGKHMAVLPAVDAIRYVDVPKAVLAEARAAAAAPGAQPSPFVAFATLAKNAMMAVRVSGSTAFLIDVGGRPSIVSPGALTAIESALGVTNVREIIITHAHLDHYESLGEVALRYGITPRNVSFPAEFMNVPAFRQFMEALGRDPNLEALGYGANAQFNLIPTQTAAGFFRVERTEGDVDFVYAGLSRPMRQGFTGSAGARGPRQVRASEVDAGSMIVRVTHRTTGKTELYLSDMRGETRVELRNLMGDTAYNELVGRADTVVLLSHHMGVAKGPDLAEHADLIIRSGATRVTVQSQEEYGGKQFLNRSQIRALNELGVEVEVLHEPAAGGPGTVARTTAGASQLQGGRIEVLAAAPRGLEVRGRLDTLRRVEQVLTEFEEFAQTQYRQSAEVRAARERIEREWQSYTEYTMSNALEGSAVQGQATFKDPAGQEARARRIGQREAIEDHFTPSYMEFITELARTGPHYRTYRAELEASRTTGELSEAGFEAMWEIDPGAARRLLESSGLSRGMRRKIGRYMPGQDIPVRSRAVAGFLLGIEIFNEIIAPAVMEYNAAAYNAHVAPFLEIIQWWKSKGVTPSLQAVNDRWWPRSNEWTHDEDRIVALLQADDLDWLTMTDIPEEEWDDFTLWASTILTDYNDFQVHIWRSPAISFVDGDWAFKTGEIEGTWSGHEMSTKWRHHPRLSAILNASLQRVQQNTKRMLEQKMAAPDSSQASTARVVDDIMGVLYAMPPPTGRYRFRAGQAQGTMYSISRGEYRDRMEIPIDGNLLVYTFPATSIEQYNGDVPNGFVVVGGADYAAFSAIRSAPNRTKVRTGTFTSGDPIWAPYTTDDNPFEVLLARESDLEKLP